MDLDRSKAIRVTDFILSRPESAVGWELRTALATGSTVRLALSERCDGIHRNPDGQRILEGRVQRVSATNAYCVVQGRHVPLSDVLAVSRPHFTQGAASDPSDPLDRAADYTDAPLGCDTCQGTGWMCAAYPETPADFTGGHCCGSSGGCPSANGCPDCDRALAPYSDAPRGQDR
jgi:hypothetical protein